MRYRKLDVNGDATFGSSMGNIWHNQVEGVGQAIMTRLLLFRGEWFLDQRDGTPWGEIPLNRFVLTQGEILGVRTAVTRDLAIKERVLRTQGVRGIFDYSSHIDPTTRRFSVGMVVDTIYGRLVIEGSDTAFTVSVGQSLLAAPAASPPALGPPQRRLPAPSPRMIS